MPLYTFILEFDGGTYISQVQAQDAKSAPEVWGASLKSGDVRGLRDASIRRLRADLASDEPVPLTGLEMVWCMSTLVRGRLALVNFVQTSPNSESEQDVPPNA